MCDPRLTAIEIALTHQQAAVEDLSDVVRDQAARMARLERLIAALTARLGEAREDADARDDPDVRPPHW